MTTTRLTLLGALALGLACGDDISPPDVPRKDDPADVRNPKADVRNPKADVRNPEANPENGPAHRDAPRSPGSGQGRADEPAAPAKLDTKNDTTPRSPGTGAAMR